RAHPRGLPPRTGIARGRAHPESAGGASELGKRPGNRDPVHKILTSRTSFTAAGNPALRSQGQKSVEIDTLVQYPG
ncbi:MAG: hypothetical protein OXC17_02715, partial [Aestuariivita sp.]|nr:hypothetical protein [Aestuariivita sp.]